MFLRKLAFLVWLTLNQGGYLTMSNLATQQTLQSAVAKCQESGARLTEKRKRALTLLLDAASPISAYELKDAYQERYDESLTAMSAYRMLNFLVTETLAHKLNSVNKYAACAHISCSHDHELPQFLICDACEAVVEIGLDDQTLEKIKEGVANTGFTLNEQQLELRGFCGDCRSGA